MQCRDDDDRQTDQDFESDWIDGTTPLELNAKDAKSFRKERKERDWSG
jgi:hypothetical protein